MAKRARKRDGGTDANGKSAPLRIVGRDSVADLLSKLPRRPKVIDDPVRRAAVDEACTAIETMPTETIIRILPVLAKFSVPLQLQCPEPPL